MACSKSFSGLVTEKGEILAVCEEPLPSSRCDLCHGFAPPGLLFYLCQAEDLPTLSLLLHHEARFLSSLLGAPEVGGRAPWRSQQMRKC